MDKVRRYEDFEVWQLARKLTVDVYAVTRHGSFAKDFGLKDQIQRAAVSIGSNIAEGYERSGNKEFVNYLWIAKGSAAEVSSQLYTALDVGYITSEQFEDLHGRAKLICAKIYKLIVSIKTSSLKGIRYTLHSSPSTNQPL